MHVFEGNTADEVWLAAAAELTDSERGQAGRCRELPGAAFTIRNPRQRWVLSRYPTMNPAFAIAEVVWIVSGRRDAAFLNYWNPKLPRLAGHAQSDQRECGFRLRKHLGPGELEKAYQALREHPDAPQTVLPAGDGPADPASTPGRPAQPDATTLCSCARIREGKLEWTQFLPDNDLFLGLPHNFVQFSLLQEILAAWLGIEVGHYRHRANRLHLCVPDKNHFRDAFPAASRENTDALRFTQAESGVFFAELSRRMEEMTSLLLTKNQLRQLARAEPLPKPLRHWLLVAAADSARRRGWLKLGGEFMAECANPALKQLWERWLRQWWTLRQEETVSDDAFICVQPWLPLPVASP
jgi:thymidylate synthase